MLKINSIVFFAMSLLVITSLCTDSSYMAAHPAKSPFQLTAQPVVERSMMRSPLAQRDRKDFFEVRCVLTNTSNHIQGFHTSAMAEWLDWKTSDPRVFIPPILFISVAIKTIKLRPGEQYVYSVPLSFRHERSGQTVKFRIGFRLSQRELRQQLRQDVRPVPEQTVWSSVISVKVHPEWANP